MATIDTIRDRLRLELGDQGQSFQAKTVVDGATVRFDLPVEFVSSTGLKVYLASAPGTLYSEYTDFNIDGRNGVLTMIIAPAASETLVVEGTFTEAFLDTELDAFITTAFLQHAHGRKDAMGAADLTLAGLPGVEEYLVVLLAETEALWAMLTDAAQEVDVRSPDGVTIPVGQRYQQLFGLIAAKKAQYAELAQALNVGLHRIEMFTLRRVSRTTNRLVPIYQTMEYDQVNKGFTPDHGAVGTVVFIKGEYFTGATSVEFNGTAADTFEVINDNLVSATVPAGATTGRIKITTPGGDIETHYGFTVGSLPPVIALGASAQRLYPPIDDGAV